MVKKIEKAERKSFGELYAEKQQKFDKSDAAGEVTTEWLIRNWSVVPSVLLAIGSMGLGLWTYSSTNSLSTRIEKLAPKVEAVEKEYNNAKDSKKVDVVTKTVDVRTHNAIEVGQRIADLEMSVTKRVDVTNVSDENLKKASDEIKELMSLTGMNRSNAYATWTKLPDWTLEFKSMVSYESSDANVVFVIKDGSGKVMGLVTGVYHDDSKTITNINVTYTREGDSFTHNRGGN